MQRHASKQKLEPMGLIWCSCKSSSFFCLFSQIQCQANILVVWLSPRQNLKHWDTVSFFWRIISILQKILTRDTHTFLVQHHPIFGLHFVSKAPGSQLHGALKTDWPPCQAHPCGSCCRGPEGEHNGFAIHSSIFWSHLDADVPSASRPPGWSYWPISMTPLPPWRWVASDWLACTGTWGGLACNLTIQLRCSPLFLRLLLGILERVWTILQGCYVSNFWIFVKKNKDFKAQLHSCVPEWLLTAFSHLTSSVQLPSSCCHGCSGPAGHRIATHTAGPAFWPTRSPRVISPSAIALSLHPLAWAMLVVLCID